MIKVLIVTPYLNSVYGGVTKVVQEVSEALGKQGQSVDLLTTNAQLENDPNFPINTWIEQNSYRVRYCPCQYRNDLVFSSALLSWLWENIDTYDLVHTHTVFSPLMSLVFSICRIKGIPYIITPHGMLEPWSINNKKQKKIIYYHLWEKHNLRNATAIQAIATAEQNNLQTYKLNTEIILVPNGLHKQDFISLPEADLFYQKFPETKDKILLLFLARIDPKKGLNLLAPAFAQVKAKYPQAHLIVAGPDSVGYLPTAKSYFEQAGCLDSVTFTGMLIGDLKYSALSATSIYVAPSYSEGFSMSVLEGMASNSTCVITTGCNFPEAKEANVAQVVDINSDAIAQALLWCFAHPEEAKQMASRARDFILDNYTWEEIAKKLINSYEKILEPKK